MEMLQNKLSQLGYTKFKKQTRNTLLVYVPKSERDITLDELSEKLIGVRDKRPETMRKISSAGAVYFPDGPYKDLFLGVKPDASSTLSTDEQETLAGIFIATKQAKPDTNFSYSDLENFGDANTNSRFKISQLYEKAGKGWINSSIVIAETLSPFLDGKYKVQQRSGSTFVTNISNNAQKLVREAGHTMGLDKWNPADIWLVKANLLATNFGQFKNIMELNQFLLEKFKKKEIIGVSLKQVGKTAKVQVFNDGPQEQVVYSGFDVGKTGFVRALNGTLYWDGGSMIIRNFGRPENVSGEINGKYAQGGKVGHGPLLNIMKQIVPGFTTTPHQQISSMYNNTPDKLYRHLFAQAKKLDTSLNPSYTVDQFRAEVEAKDNTLNYLISKYQVSDIMQAIKKMTKIQRDKLIRAFIGYASSSTEVSSIFYKVS